MVDHPILLLVALGVAAPVLWLLWRQLFGDRSGFVDDLRQSTTPELIAAWRGHHQERGWSSAKLGLFVLVGLGLVAGLYRAGTILFF